MEKGEIAKRHIHQEVVKALINSRLPYEGPLCDALENEAQVVGAEGSPCIRIVDAEGNWIMLEERIKELKTDPRFRDSVPNPTRVELRDESSLRDNFEGIARGTAVVQ